MTAPRNPKSAVVWETLRNANCRLCTRHQSAETVCLLGDGLLPAPGMIIGDAPGIAEDKAEKPFMGKSGMFLRRSLGQVGIDPHSVYFTYSVACRSAGDKSPSRGEVKTCSSEYLPQQIELVKPKAILLLGNNALSFGLGRKGAVTKLEGTTFTRDGITYVPCRSPGSVTRAEGEKEYDFLVQKFKENLLLFKRVLYPSEDKFNFINPDSPPEFPDGWIYVDIETNGLNPYREDSTIHSMALQHQDSEDVYCFERAKFPNSYYRKLFKKHDIIAHRGTFEGTWIKSQFGITPKLYFDTKLGAFAMDENEQSGLKYQAVKHLGVEPWDEGIDFENPDFEIMLPYNARDTSYGVRLYRECDLPYLKEFPKQAKLLKHILMPAQEVFVDVIDKGFHINEESATEKLALCKSKLEDLNEKIDDVAGRHVNPGSPKQMIKLLYDDLNLTCPVQTKKGAESSSEAALIRLAGEHVIVDLLLEWRKWKKFDSTYLTPWLRKGPVLHANYGFTDVDTGRLNSTMVKNKRGEKKAGATLHQCPRDKFIRNLITARKPGWHIVAADLSQIELRLVAHAADEKVMIEVFNDPDGDIHLSTAETLVQGEIDKEIRKRAKAVNFGFVYGMWAKKFVAYAKEKFGLNLTQREGHRYREQFFDKYPGLLPWHRRVESFVGRNGHIDSVFGRRRRLPEAKTDSGYDEWIRNRSVRQGINSPIQSAGSDLNLFIIALLMYRGSTWKYKLDPSKVMLVGSAHDSQIYECQGDYIEELKYNIQQTASNLPVERYFNFRFKVPIKMDVTPYEDCWEGKELVI